MRNVSKSQMHWVWSVRHRLFVSVLFAMAVAVFLPPTLFPSDSDAVHLKRGRVSFLLLTWMLMLQGTPEMMRHHAQQLDARRLTILSTIVAAACASLLAITSFCCAIPKACHRICYFCTWGFLSSQLLALGCRCTLSSPCTMPAATTKTATSSTAATRRRMVWIFRATTNQTTKIFYISPLVLG